VENPFLSSTGEKGILSNQDVSGVKRPFGREDISMKNKLSMHNSTIVRGLEEAAIINRQKRAKSSHASMLEVLRQSEERHRMIIENIEEGYFEVDLAGKFNFLNNAMCLLLGYSREEMTGMNSRQFTDRETSKEVLQIFNRVYKTGESAKGFDWKIVRKDGTKRCIEASISLLKDSSDQPKGFRIIVRDITERRQAESQRDVALEALRKSEELNTRLVDTIPDIIIRTDLDGQILFVNNHGLQIGGYNRDEVVGKNMMMFIASDDHEKLLQNASRMMERRLGPQEYQILMKDGRAIPFEVNGDILSSKDGTPSGLVFVCRDIAERKQAQNHIQVSEEQYRSLVNNMQDAVFRSDLDGKLTFTTPSAARILGCSSVEEMIGLNISDDFSYKPAELKKQMEMLLERGTLTNLEVALKRRDNDEPVIVSARVQFFRDQQGNIVGIEGVYSDITKRKEVEEALKASEEKHRKIFEGAAEGIYQTIPKGRFLSMNPAVAKMFGYASPEEMIDSVTDIGKQLYVNPNDREEMMRMLGEHSKLDGYEIEVYHKDRSRFWIAVNIHTVRDDAGKIIYFEGTNVNITRRKLAEEKFRKIYMLSPECIAITRLEEGIITDVNKAFEDILGWRREEVIGTISTEPPMNFWVNPSNRGFMVAELKAGRNILNRQFEFRRSDGSVRAGVYSARPIIIDEEECLIFILQDITEHLRMDIELRRTLESLRKAFNTTINVMISAIEMRDPYTAGHQKKSADFARTIATEMGLDQEKIDGIRMAGIIHDIGKLAIPSEILTKPTKLTEIEFSLIKEHSRSGYEMLKDVESPWPLAEIVYQHHERMDGSGYPRNLKGDEILIEARILAVADVVESMASHRPYRASLGIEAALEEIEKNKGILYDDGVADACLRLFRVKGYHLL